MIIKQLSVFLENRLGRLAEIASALGEAGINMTAFSLAETSDFGILRLVVSTPQDALEVLKAKDYSVSLTDVICLSVPNEPGGLAKALKILSDENIRIEYLYAFSVDKDALVVIKPDNIVNCIRVLQEHQMELKKANDLYSI